MSVKRLVCMLTIVMVWFAAGAFADTDKAVRTVMQDVLRTAAGAADGYLLETEADTAELLAWMNHWFVTITDDYVLLETAQDAYLAVIYRDDPVEVLGMVLACKAAFHDFVDETIVVFIEWSGMDGIAVDDEGFAMQVEMLENLGYQQLRKENVLALRRSIASALGVYVSDSSFTYYDRYVDQADERYTPSSEVCFYCHGTGKCRNCGGDGLYSNPFTGGLMECTCEYGLCPTCDGTGWW